VPDELLTVQEVADFLRLNQQTVRNAIDRGELAAVRIGKRRVRIRQSDLDAFVEAGYQPVAAPEPSEPEPEIDEGSITAWATFGAAMAETTAVLERTDQAELVQALDSLSEATRSLAAQLRAAPSRK
jgi:excisionase family DNA binding protein